MKIKIKVELPVPECVRPAIGSIHEVVETDPATNEPIGRSRIYFILVGDHKARIGVFPSECEIVEG